jgi:hypothetical protein
MYDHNRAISLANSGFTGHQPIVSPTFPNLNLIAAQVLPADVANTHPLN